MGNQYLILKWQSHATNIEIWCIWPLANTLTSILSLNTLIYIWLAYLCLKGVSSFTRRSTLTPSCGTWNQFQCFIGPDWLASKGFCIIPVTTPAMKSPKSLKELHTICASPLLPPLPWICPEDSWSCMLFLHHPCYHPYHEFAQKIHGVTCYFCITPVTTPTMKLPRRFMELHAIFALPLLPPLPWGWIEAVGTS